MFLFWKGHIGTREPDGLQKVSPTRETAFCLGLLWCWKEVGSLTGQVVVKTEEREVDIQEGELVELRGQLQRSIIMAFCITSCY